MKYLIVFSSFIFLFSCKKALNNVEDYFPKAQLTYIENADGTIMLKGTIVDEGASEIETMGFCYSDSPEFDITSNQIAILDKSNFTATLPLGFDPNKTYYFKAFASNSYGASESKIIEISNIESEPITTICSLSSNTFSANLFGSITSFEPASNVFNEIMYKCSGSSNSTFEFYFKSPPVTGLYKTTTNYTAQGEVYISGSIGYNTFQVKPDADVYVTKISETQFRIEICYSLMQVNGYDFPFKVKIDRNY